MDTQGIRQAVGRTLVAAAVSGLVLAQTAVADSAAVAPKAPATPTTPAKPPKIQVKSPGEMAAQVCTLLAVRKMPWQIYQSYSAIFEGFAARQARVPAATPEAQQQRQRLVIHYRGMANLLQQMQECAAIRDGIKQHRTEIPFGERQIQFTEAGKRHDLLLQQFVAMGSKLPGFRLAAKPAPTQTPTSGTRSAPPEQRAP